MSPSIMPERVTPSQFAPVETAPARVVTILPRTTFNPPNQIQSVNEQVEAHKAAMQARDNTLILKGFLNGMQRTIDEKFAALNRKIDTLAVKIDALAADE